ncbi:hypothetical protein BA894_19695 [Vibrio natriegens]|uniref:type II secretion system F family protein n=1 Tax=Vibrio natriegens TaxID=691 RepID=UPI000803E699|nr:type II secretion system F family protein [Vibrio natriegens]ANQ28637.1 hypothetical protein BA894_19695 [Vibrio natriegens]
MNALLILSSFFFLISAVVWLVLLKAPSPAEYERSVSPKKPTTKYQEQFNEWWTRTGFTRSPIKISILALLLFSVTYFTYFTSGALTSFFVGAASILFLFMLTQWHRNNLKRQLIKQLPSFIDQVSRRMKIGMSTTRAVEQASKGSSKPLSIILSRVMHRHNLGIELQDAFYTESVITGVRPFHLLASIFRINTQYGGNATDSLDSLVQLLRQQDISQRELKAITGETRITAWVVGSAPIIVGSYMMKQNPELLIDMWATDNGQYALVLAGALQVVGILLIWRMLRSL